MPFLVIELWHEKRGGQVMSFEQVRVGKDHRDTMEILDATVADLGGDKEGVVSDWLSKIGEGSSDYGDLLRIATRPGDGGVVMVIPTQYLPGMFKVGKETVTRTVEIEEAVTAIVRDDDSQVEEQNISLKKPAPRKKAKPLAKKKGR